MPRISSLVALSVVLFCAVPGRHAKAGWELADDLSIDPRRQAGELETVDADHLCGQLLGHARFGATCAERQLRRTRTYR